MRQSIGHTRLKREKKMIGGTLEQKHLAGVPRTSLKRDSAEAGTSADSAPLFADADAVSEPDQSSLSLHACKSRSVAVTAVRSAGLG